MLCCLLTLLLAASSLQSELKILSTPEGKPGPPPCALTCSGVARYSEEGASLYSSWERIYEQACRYVNIQECGFVAAPVVTATLRGPLFGARKCPSIYLHQSYVRMFLVVTVGNITASQMTWNQCDVYWTANGYNC